MPGEVGANERLRVAQETVWGVNPSAGRTPIIFDEYGLHAVEQLAVFDEKKGGGPDIVWRRHMGYIVEGPINMQLHPDIANLIAGIYFRRVSDEQNSFTWEWKLGSGTAADVYTLRHLGTKCRSFSIASSADDGKVLFSGDFQGSEEVDRTGSAFPDPSVPVRPWYLFQDATFVLNGLANTDISSFSIDVDNGLEAGPLSSDDAAGENIISWLETGKRAVSGTIELFLEDDTFEAMVRGGDPTDFNIQFDFPEVTSPSGQFVIDLPRIFITEDPRSGGSAEQVKQTLNFTADFDSTAGYVMDMTAVETPAS